jgi:hypothetical protein
MLLSIINVYFYFFNRFSLNFVKKVGIVFRGASQFTPCVNLTDAHSYIPKNKKTFLRTDSFAKSET